MEEFLEEIDGFSFEYNLIISKTLFSRMYALVHARIVKIWLQIDWIFRLTHYWKQKERGKRLVHGFLKNVSKKLLASP